MKKLVTKIILLVMAVGCLTGCGKKKQQDYAAFLKEQPTESYCAEVNIGLEHSVLLITDGVYDNGDGTQAAIDAQVYYLVDGEVLNIGEISSDGTAYPLSVDETGIYAGGNHGAEKYTYNETQHMLQLAEAVYVDYSGNTDNGTYTAMKNGETSDSTEEEFNAFYDAFGKATAINFVPINAGKGKDKE